MTPDNDDPDWSGQENLEQRRREEEMPRMQNREKIERLNQAIAILEPVFTLTAGPSFGEAQKSLASCLKLVETLEKEINIPISNGWFV